MPVVTNYGYLVDLSKCEPVDQIQPLKHDRPVIAYGEYIEPVADEESVARVLKNDGLVIAAILGGYALLCVLAVLISVVVKKNRGRIR